MALGSECDLDKVERVRRESAGWLGVINGIENLGFRLWKNPRTING